MTWYPNKCDLVVFSQLLEDLSEIPGALSHIHICKSLGLGSTVVYWADLCWKTVNDRSSEVHASCLDPIILIVYIPNSICNIHMALNHLLFQNHLYIIPGHYYRRETNYVPSIGCSCWSPRRRIRKHTFSKLAQTRILLEFSVWSPGRNLFDNNSLHPLSTASLLT